jgi:hypothetical protein
MKLSLERTEVEVELEGKDGEVKRWLLRELDGSERNRYLNKMKDRVKVNKDGKGVGIKSFDGFQSALLTISLFDEHGENVTKDVIEGLPSKTQHQLFKKAQEISGLSDEEDASKND